VDVDDLQSTLAGWAGDAEVVVEVPSTINGPDVRALRSVTAVDGLVERDGRVVAQLRA
jgi:hypothetical protein